MLQLQHLGPVHNPECAAQAPAFAGRQQWGKAQVGKASDLLQHREMAALKAVACFRSALDIR